MGADIHMAIEVRNTYKTDGEWKYIEIKNQFRSYKESDGTEYIDILEPYSGRDYGLFGILAGVRSDVYHQIDSLRGMPEDVSEGVKERYNKEESYGGVHSLTWYTLDELEGWGERKKHFKSANYRELAEYDEGLAIDTKREDKNMRKRFNMFVHDIENFVWMTIGYVSPCNVRAVIWFDS